MGAIKTVQEKLSNPFWIEIGPGPVCNTFIRATLAPPAAKLTSSLEPKTNPWLSVSRYLASAYEDGAAVDWLAFHAPFTKGLNLLTLPSYAWDIKDL